MSAVVIIFAAILGGGIGGVFGAVFGGVLGGLAVQVHSLRKEIAALRQRVDQLSGDEQPAESAAPADPVAKAFAERPSATARTKAESPGEPTGEADTSELQASSAPETPPARPSAAQTTPKPPPPRAKTAQPQGGAGDAGSAVAAHMDRAVAWVRDFFLTGNPIVRVGMVVLFFGVAFLLKYAADRSLFPIELRLAAVAAGGMALLVVGWRLRWRNAVFAMVMQGGGVGVLYLTVYAAAQLYDVLPVGLAFAVMVALVALSGLLAVLQNAMALAVFGTAGGFLAPVLASTGEGSHVALFSYYALLNVGILGIAWFRAWRELNLLGFVFTFVVGTAWGYRYYQPAFFASTEPFLVLFFLFFVAIAVLYAFRQPPRLRGYVDGTLIFGVPLAGFGLQAGLVHEMAFGMAYSAVAMAAFYLALAWALWSRRAAGMAALTEAFLALGVVFATLAIPLAFDGRWTAASWALEGAGLVWVGLRQGRLIVRAAGVLLQLGAGAAFIVAAPAPVGDLMVLNGFYIGCLLIAFAAWSGAYFAHRYGGMLPQWERAVGTGLLYWGLAWWFVGAVADCFRVLTTSSAVSAVWLLAVATAAAGLLIGRRLEWVQVSHPAIGLLPFMALTGVLVGSLDEHVLIGWSWVAWLALPVVHYLGLRWYEMGWPTSVVRGLHPAVVGVAAVLLVHESAWLFGDVLDFPFTWLQVVTVAPAIALVFGLIYAVARLPWPFGAYRRLYLEAAAMPIAGLLTLWALAACLHDADPALIGYVPVLNPLEIAQMAAVLALVVVHRRLSPSLREALGPAMVYTVTALGFIGLTTLIARGVHHWGGVAYTPDGLWASAVFHTALAVFWTVAALGLMALAARRVERLVWFAGAGLLALVLAKLFLVDLAGVGTVARIVSFLAVGVLMLVIGYFSPLPPRSDGKEAA